MDLNRIFTLGDAWVDFLTLFGAANIAVGLAGTALRRMGKGGLKAKRAALFVMAGALFIVCSIRYKRERALSPAPQTPPALGRPARERQAEGSPGTTRGFRLTPNPTFRQERKVST